MAIYIYKFWDKSKTQIGEYPFEIWQGNRDLSNKRAIAIGVTVFSYLSYRDEISQASMWLAIGNAGEKYIQSIEDLIDWGTGAVTVDYQVAGRSKTAVFTQNAALGAMMSPIDSLQVLDAEKAFDQSF